MILLFNLIFFNLSHFYQNSSWKNTDNNENFLEKKNLLQSNNANNTQQNNNRSELVPKQSKTER